MITSYQIRTMENQEEVLILFLSNLFKNIIYFGMVPKYF